MIQILEALWITATVLAMYLLADLLGGIFHWSEDTLGADDTPIWGPLFAAPNSKHHREPTAMNQIPWFRNNALLFGASALVVAIAHMFSFLTWQLALLMFLTSLNQQVHRFSHTPSRKLPTVARRLQDWRIIQNAPHHWRHHRPPHTTHYCALTPWLNPVLDRIGFWRALERVLVPVFGAPRREDLQGKKWYKP